jgi:hypothetical protein
VSPASCRETDQKQDSQPNADYRNAGTLTKKC